MALSNPARIVCATFLLSLFFSGCAVWRRTETPSGNFALPKKRVPPFSTREPETFQAEIVVRTGDVERRTLIARDGNLQRIDFDPETASHRAVLITDKEYVLDFDRMVFVERELSGASFPQNESLAHLLNLRDYTEFEEVGREDSLVRYRARINDSSASEVVILFDERIQLPVRQEFYSIDGDQRTLKYSVELKNFKTEADRRLFQVPPGWRRESAVETGRDREL